MITVMISAAQILIQLTCQPSDADLQGCKQDGAASQNLYDGSSGYRHINVSPVNQNSSAKGPHLLLWHCQNNRTNTCPPTSVLPAYFYGEVPYALLIYPFSIHDQTIFSSVDEGGIHSTRTHL